MKKKVNQKNQKKIIQKIIIILKKIKINMKKMKKKKEMKIFLILI